MNKNTIKELILALQEVLSKIWISKAQQRQMACPSKLILMCMMIT